jgi:hypothetical protein
MRRGVTAAVPLASCGFATHILLSGSRTTAGSGAARPRSGAHHDVSPFAVVGPEPIHRDTPPGPASRWPSEDSPGNQRTEDQ